MVDRAIDIVDRFHESILKLEREILLNPKMNSVRDCARSQLLFNHPLMIGLVHSLSAEVTQRRRELDPVKTLIYGLRRYDSDRALAAEECAVEDKAHHGGPGAGFLSHKAKVYLADVHEHAEFIMTRYAPQQDPCKI